MLRTTVLAAAAALCLPATALPAPGWTPTETPVTLEWAWAAHAALGGDALGLLGGRVADPDELGIRIGRVAVEVRPADEPEADDAHADRRAHAMSRMTRGRTLIRSGPSSATR